METNKINIYDVLMWGLVIVTIGFAGHVYNAINVAMQAL
jgi:hypothetical protein